MESEKKQLVTRPLQEQGETRPAQDGHSAPRRPNGAQDTPKGPKDDRRAPIGTPKWAKGLPQSAKGTPVGALGATWVVLKRLGCCGAKIWAPKGDQNGTKNGPKSKTKPKTKTDTLEDRLEPILEPSWVDLGPLRSPKSCSRLGRSSFF